MNRQASLNPNPLPLNPSPKVFVGLSGGVDSSVSAALLKRDGYDVTGVFIKVWTPDFFECTWKDDRLDAMRVCAKLDIPFITLDLEKEYKKEVVDYMIAEYKAGRTPNPDVMCNRHIKFGAFFKWAMSQGADFIATGHYARVEGVRGEGVGSRGRKKLSSLYPIHYTLYASADSNKDQSYFLYTLTQKELAHVLFPVGHLKKPEVRKLAEKFELITATKKDSQGLCFIGKVDMKDFLKEFMPEKKGVVLNEAGEIIGEHDGAFFFTMGERHGFHITKKTPHDAPYYVVSKDQKKNTLTVSHNKVSDEKNKFAHSISFEKPNWISGVPDFGKKYTARIRYRAPLRSCMIAKKGKAYEAGFDAPQEAVSPGQSIVFYDDDVCLGGGIIN